MLHFELGAAGFAELNLQVQPKCSVALYGRTLVEFNRSRFTAAILNLKFAPFKSIFQKKTQKVPL